MNDWFNFKSDLYEEMFLNSTFYSVTPSDDLGIIELTNNYILDESFQNNSINDDEYFGYNNSSNNSVNTSTDDESL